MQNPKETKHNSKQNPKYFKRKSYTSHDGQQCHGHKLCFQVGVPKVMCTVQYIQNDLLEWDSRGESTVSHSFAVVREIIG